MSNAAFATTCARIADRPRAGQRQSAGRDRGHAAIGVGAGQRLGAGGERQPAAAADHAGEGVVRGRQHQRSGAEIGAAAARQPVDAGARAGQPGDARTVPLAIPWLDAEMSPAPASASVPAVIVVAPV